MKLNKFFPAMALVTSLYAQDVAEEPLQQEDPAKPSPPKAQVIDEEEPTAEEISKVDPSEKTQPTAPDVVVEETSPDDTSTEGTSPEGTSPEESIADIPALAEPEVVIEETPEVKKPVNEGVKIQVEKVSSGTGESYDGGPIKVTSPWPAKPLDQAPLGWKYIPASSDVDPYRTTVKLDESKSVNLAITPYVLVPASDGLNVIRIVEPGYQSDQDHSQKNTIGAMLLQSTEEIEYHEKQTADVIERLQELLSSLPKQ